MLQDLIQLLSNNSLLITAEIKDLESSSCPSSKEVIDYDKVKIKYCKDAKIAASPKSVDALLLNTSKDKVSFIEMKALLTVFHDINNNNYTLEEAKKLIEHTFKVEFEVDKKILDSFMLLLDIARHFEIDNTFFPYFISDNCKKEFYFVLGCSPRDFVRWHLSILPLTHKYEYFKLGQAKFIPWNSFDQVFP